MELIVSEFFEFQEYSSLMIYKLKYCFEKLFWVYYNADRISLFNQIDELKVLYGIVINSKS